MATALDGVDDECATIVVTVEVRGGMVVPAMVENLVVAGTTVPPATVLGSIVSTAIVDGGTVVPGMVVV